MMGRLESLFGVPASSAVVALLGAACAECRHVGLLRPSWPGSALSAFGAAASCASLSFFLQVPSLPWKVISQLRGLPWGTHLKKAIVSRWKSLLC